MPPVRASDLDLYCLSLSQVWYNFHLWVNHGFCEYRRHDFTDVPKELALILRFI